MSPALLVQRPGPLTTVQDLGRPGWAHLGVSPSGAADRASLRSANRCVGNPDGAAALEVTLGGMVVRAEGDLVVAVTGMADDVTVDGRAVAAGAAAEVADGQRLSIGAGRDGVRAYLAVRGGLAVEPVLGSRATDTLAGIGPPRVRAGDVLPVGEPPVLLDPAEPDRRPASLAGEVALRVLPGPRVDWFRPEAWQALVSEPFRVTPDGNRVALRLDGPALPRSREDELPSEGLVRGAVQVPPGGRPVLFLADHPVTGGYPVLAVVVDDDTDLAGQARPGRTVRFLPAG